MHCQLRERPEVDDPGGRGGATVDAVAERSRPRLAGGLRRALVRVQGWVLPPRCVLCLDSGRAPVLDLCPACEADLPMLGPACPRCATPGRPGGARDAGRSFDADCAHCRGTDWPFARALVPYRYDWPADALVKGLKYRGQLAHARVLGALLAEAASVGPESAPPLLVPVPLHARRERERGYNQAWEIARVTARELGVRADPSLCVRVRETPAQAGLSAADRSSNVADAFAVRRSPGVTHVALVDDVMTTGATLVALARPLLAAGVRRIEAWAVARAVQGAGAGPAG